VPGASAVLLAGLVTYANAAKEKFLGGARKRSRRTARSAKPSPTSWPPARGAQPAPDYALAVTGIAGRPATTADKPVGTMFPRAGNGGRNGGGTEAHAGNRETFKN